MQEDVGLESLQSSFSLLISIAKFGSVDIDLSDILSV